MNELTQQYWSRALKIARQYAAGEVNFADLTGLGDEFAASFTEEIQHLPDATRTKCCQALETRLGAAINDYDPENPAGQALGELLVSITRTPIY